MMSSSNEADLHEDSIDLDEDKPARAHASDEGINSVWKLKFVVTKSGSNLTYGDLIFFLLLCCLYWVGVLCGMRIAECGISITYILRKF